MDSFLQANRNLWDQWTHEHEASPFYDVAGFKAGRDRLRSIELTELGDVQGRSLLHLQCHFGLDTLAWARRGAVVTGTDLSEASISLARSLSEELALPAKFVACDLYDLPAHLTGEFDIVFTSYGVLHWLRDLHRWAQIVAHFLKPGGIFYIVEDHPTFRMFTTENGTDIKLDNPYFFSETPNRNEITGSYATDFRGDRREFFMWDHGLGEVVTSLIDAGLSIEYLHEFPYAARAKFPFMEQGADGWWRLPEKYVQIPFLFSLQARKPFGPAA
ncbi:MAG TPA: class I SAM-dependent methyltransferase [Anaerolineales bacterium]